MNEATEKQTEYAKAISECLGVKLPTENTKSAYSQWLDKYSKPYKQKRYEDEIMGELEIEMIDTRRDW